MDRDKLFHDLRAQLQDLQADTKANARDLRNLVKRTNHMDETLRGLLGTFAGIEEMLKQDASAISDLQRRVEALERRQPPAA
jgi:predicted nuclease with TOPRIM domain